MISVKKTKYLRDDISNNTFYEGDYASIKTVVGWYPHVMITKIYNTRVAIQGFSIKEDKYMDIVLDIDSIVLMEKVKEE